MKYPKVFQGVGKLKDFNLHLHVDQNVPPVAQKLRRVPFALREKVSAKIDEFLREDIIKWVEGPTTWASLLVVAPKPSREIRLCVDMRCPNKAIIRERLPIPTVDEVLEEIYGSMVFSKLGLRWEFHQRLTWRFDRNYYFYYPWRPLQIKKAQFWGGCCAQEIPACYQASNSRDRGSC